MKTKQWSKLAGILFTTGTIGLTVSPVYADDITGNDNNGVVEINNDNIYNQSVSIYGWHMINNNKDAIEGRVNISDGTIGLDNVGSYNAISIYGGYSDNGDAKNNKVNVSDGTVRLDNVGSYNAISIYGGYSSG